MCEACRREWTTFVRKKEQAQARQRRAQGQRKESERRRRNEGPGATGRRVPEHVDARGRKDRNDAEPAADPGATGFTVPLDGEPSGGSGVDGAGGSGGDAPAAGEAPRSPAAERASDGAAADGEPPRTGPSGADAAPVPATPNVSTLEPEPGAVADAPVPGSGVGASSGASEGGAKGHAENGNVEITHARDDTPPVAPDRAEVPSLEAPLSEPVDKPLEGLDPVPPTSDESADEGPPFPEGSPQPSGEISTEPAWVRYFCPQCGHPSMMANLSEDQGVAQCRACDYEAPDLLSLIPVQPVGLLQISLGTGLLAFVRATMFLVVCLTMFVFAILPR